MIVLLRWWNVTLGLVRFDTEMGRAQSEYAETIEARKAHACHGFANGSDTDWVAVYSLGGQLWFQAGSDKWGLENSEITVSWNRMWFLAMNQFRLFKGDKCVFSKRYRSALLGALRDPTFDVLDEEGVDFYLWLYRGTQRPDWKPEVKELWARGI